MTDNNDAAQEPEQAFAKLGDPHRLTDEEIATRQLREGEVALVRILDSLRDDVLRGELHLAAGDKLASDALAAQLAKKFSKAALRDSLHKVRKRNRLLGRASPSAEPAVEDERPDEPVDDDDLHERGEAFATEGEVVELDSEAESAENAEEEALASVEPRRLVDALEQALERMDARAEKRERPITTPWRSFNDQLPGGGLWPGCHVLTSGTATGKSTWALQLALHAAREHKAAVVYAGLELEDMQIALRLLAEAAQPRRLGWSRLYVGTATREERTQARASKAALEGLTSFYVDDGDLSGWTAERMRLVAKKTRVQHPDVPLLIVVDFLQLIAAEQDTRLELRERIGKAAYMGRAIARHYDATVLLISSVGRDKYASVNGLEALAAAGLATETAHRVITERHMHNPEAFVGLGKESGEIEYAADSVTAAIGLPRSGSSRQVVFATAKLRAGRPSWCALDFDGHRFTDDPSGGARVMEALEKRTEKPAPNGGHSRGRNGGSNQEIDT